MSVTYNNLDRLYQLLLAAREWQKAVNEYEQARHVVYEAARKLEKAIDTLKDVK